MIDPKSRPAVLRSLDLVARWDVSGKDLAPSTAHLLDAITEHDRRFRAAMAGDIHRLHDRWVTLHGPFEPLSTAPFQKMSQHCANLGFGLSAAFVIGRSPDELEMMPAIARSLTHVSVSIASDATLPDLSLLEIFDQLAQTPTGLTLRGGIKRYRGLRATELPSLMTRAHKFVASATAIGNDQKAPLPERG